MNDVIDLGTLYRLAKIDLQNKQRTIWAFCGCAGSGKTTLTTALEKQLNENYQGLVLRVGLDGFHLANNILVSRNKMRSKGDLDTFDGYNLLRLLQTFTKKATEPLYFPGYDREVLHAPIAASIYAPPSIKLLILEGIWLLQSCEPWASMFPLYTKSLYLELPKEPRHKRLRKRHLLTDNANNPKAVDEHLNYDYKRDLQIEKSSSKAQFIIPMDLLKL